MKTQMSFPWPEKVLGRATLPISKRRDPSFVERLMVASKMLVDMSSGVM
jgi:hypothetical protein